MTMIAYAFLQHRRLAQAERKKESTDLRLNQACRPVRQAIVDLILP